MEENYYVYKKEVDWSLLNQGFSIPLDIQVIFQSNIRRFIRRGESKDIFLWLDGNSYKVKLINQPFDEIKYPTHKDILQVRYNPNSDIAVKLRSIFSFSYRYLYEKRLESDEKQKKYIRIPQERKEFFAVYTSEYEDTYLAECITNNEITAAKGFLIKEDEQSYEASINKPVVDLTASIEQIQQLIKIRKLNRAIGENLKMLYDYRCQICGNDTGKRYDAHVVESHHIDSFVVSMNNDAANQLIICPNHHRVIHKVEPVFERHRLLFIYKNGVEEKLLLNKHLTVV